MAIDGKPAGTVILADAVAVDEMVRYALHLGGCGLGGANAQFAEELARVGRHDFGMKLLGQLHAKSRFAHGRGAGNGE